MNAAYPLAMFVAIATGGALLRRRQGALVLAPRERLGVALGAFIGAMIGAKLPFALADGEAFLSGAAWFTDGKTILTGLVGGYLGVELAKWSLDIRTKTGDSFAVPVAVSVAIGRLGCFVGGCCYGTPTTLPWGVDFGDHIRRHPTQLYESAFHLAAAAVLAVLERYDAFRYQRIKLYLIAYCGYRFASETIRPEVAWWWGLTVYQWLCLAIVPVLLVLWRHDARRYGGISSPAG